MYMRSLEVRVALLATTALFSLAATSENVTSEPPVMSRHFAFAALGL